MHREFIKKLTNLVEANLANEKFGPEELAKEAGMSHSNLNRKLKTISNQNISQFIREIRLKKAQELLLNEDLNIAEIAYQVGFGSPTYFIRTFHEYFEVTPLEFRNQQPADKPEEKPITALPKKTKRPNFLIILIVALILLIPITFFITNKLLKSTISEKSIAVLPFIYLSHEIDNQYLAVGMMDAVLNNLSKIKDLRVISRTSVEQYRNTKKTANAIGQELDVGYLLEGSLQKDSNKVRLIVQLIRTKNEDHVWSNSYDYDRMDIFSVQSEVAETVANELQAAITPEEKQLIRKIPTTNLTAYDFYQRGKDELDKFRDDNSYRESLDKAHCLFQKALELDSTFALAYSGLAGVYESKLYWKTFLSENFMDSVLIMANRALDFDNQCAEAYYYRGSRYYQIAKIPEAVKELNKAIKFNPNDWNAYYLLSSVLGVGYNDYVGVISNRHETILRNRGKELPGLLSGLGKIYMDMGFPEIGKQYCKQAFELGGDTSRYLYCMRLAEQYAGNYENAYQLAKNVYKTDSTIGDELLIYCSLTGRLEEAYILGIKNIERYKKAGGIDLWSSKSIGYYLWQKGMTKEAEFYFNQQIKFDEESIKLGRWNSIQKGAHFDLALVYAALGDKEKAYQYLDEVNKKQFFPLWWVILFRHDPLFNGIRREPRFQKILMDVEAKFQAEHERVRKWREKQGMP